MKLRLEIKLAKILTVFVIGIFIMTVMASTGYNQEQKIDLKFKPDGTFKIVQFTDIQDGPDIDSRTINLMNRVLDYEKPDLVVLTGDITDERSKTEADVKKAIGEVAQPMEKRHIPWAVVFGNHDGRNNVMPKDAIMDVYMSYPCNISEKGPHNIDGVGNYNLLIKSSKGQEPVFNIYMLDSGRTAAPPLTGYDWIKPNQIEWYREKSKTLKTTYGRSIPALMFFHIPIPEFKQLWDSGKTVGQRNEAESSPKVDSGLFTAVLEMGDVKGIFVGHDHTNDYTGDLYGVELGYSRNTGYGTYGKAGLSRGARVFLLNENKPEQFETWMRLASDCNG
ncbi:MAG: metallophosphoesterase family protein [Bacillota bacterium]|nr:metallophosphoesterase family protein [Bacillota bacterium]